MPRYFRQAWSIEMSLTWPTQISLAQAVPVPAAFLVSSRLFGGCSILAADCFLVPTATNRLPPGPTASSPHEWLPVTHPVPLEEQLSRSYSDAAFLSSVFEASSCAACPTFVLGATWPITPWPAGGRAEGARAAGRERARGRPRAQCSSKARRGRRRSPRPNRDGPREAA